MKVVFDLDSIIFTSKKNLSIGLKTRYIILFVFFIGFDLLAIAQSGNSCDDAISLPSILGIPQSNSGATYSPAVIGGNDQYNCQGDNITLDNNLFFSFCVSNNFPIFEIIVYDCRPGVGNEALEFIFYKTNDCGTLEHIICVQGVQGDSGPKAASLFGVKENDNCIMMVDGLASSICSFTIKIDNGVTILPACNNAPCEIRSIELVNQSDCNPMTNTFTSDIQVEYSLSPSTGNLILSGDGSQTVSVGNLDSPNSHTFEDVEMTADGGQINLTAAFSADMNCSRTNPNAGLAPDPCDLPCSITDISAANISSCNPATNNFSADIEIHFNNPPIFGQLQLTGDAIQSVDVNNLTNSTSHIFQNVEMSSDGGPIELTASFTEGLNCNLSKSDLGTAPNPCNTSCNINSLIVSNLSTCDTATNLFTCDVEISYVNPPSSGRLDLFGDAFASINVGNLTSPNNHVFRDIELIADGGIINFSVVFTGEPNCTFVSSNLGSAPDPCSSDCNIFAISALNYSICDSLTNSFTCDVEINYVNPPQLGKLELIGDGIQSVNIDDLDSETRHVFQDVMMEANGQLIELAAYFTEDSSCELMQTNVGMAPASCERINQECSQIDKIAVVDPINGFEWHSIKNHGEFELIIFHRNGHILYQADYDPSNIYHGEDLEPGVYLYVLSHSSGELCIKSAVTIKK